MPDMQDKIITENGVYTSDYPYWGLGTVTVETEDQWLKRAEMLDYMFYYKSYIDFNRFNIYDAWSIAYMFDGCSSLTDMTIDGTSISRSTYAFANCPKLKSVTFNCEVNNTSIPSTAKDITNDVNYTFHRSSADVDVLHVHFKGKPYCYYMFRNSYAKSIKITTDYAEKTVSDMRHAFDNCDKLKSVDLADLKLSDISGMFYNCTSLASISDLKLDTSECTNMDSTFYGCSSLTSFSDLDLDTSKCINMKSMLHYCTSLTSVSLTKSSKCTNFENIVDNCKSLETINLNTDSCTTIGSAFSACTSLKNITLSSVKSLSGSNNMKGYVFNRCAALENLIINDTETTTVSIDLHYSTNLTVDSMLSIFNSLKTRDTMQTSSNADEGVVYLGSTNLAKLTDEQKAIAASKNWLLV